MLSITEEIKSLAQANSDMPRTPGPFLYQGFSAYLQMLLGTSTL